MIDAQSSQMYALLGIHCEGRSILLMRTTVMRTHHVNSLIFCSTGTCLCSQQAQFCNNVHPESLKSF